MWFMMLIWLLSYYTRRNDKWIIWNKIVFFLIFPLNDSLQIQLGALAIFLIKIKVISIRCGTSSKIHLTDM